MVWGKVFTFGAVLCLFAAPGIAAQETAASMGARTAITIVPKKSSAMPKKGVVYYVDQTGVPTLTNRHDSYRINAAFEMVHEPYAPVVIPGRYRGHRLASQYTANDVAFLVSQYARQYRLDENLVFAVIKAESNFNPYAVSPAGARGLMQLMPGTAAEMRVTDIFDPAQNIAGGTQYLARMLKMFKNDRALALAAYNAGPGTVQRYGGVPPYKETQAYIKRVERFHQQFAGGAAAPTLHAGGKRPDDTFVPGANKRYTIHLASGATQPADSIRDEKDFYIVEYAKKLYPVSKKLVTQIVEHG